jgi:hypothetical protein
VILANYSPSLGVIDSQVQRTYYLRQQRRGMKIALLRVDMGNPGSNLKPHDQIAYNIALGKLLRFPRSEAPNDMEPRRIPNQRISRSFNGQRMTIS